LIDNFFIWTGIRKAGNTKTIAGLYVCSNIRFMKQLEGMEAIFAIHLFMIIRF